METVADSNATSQPERRADPPECSATVYPPHVLNRLRAQRLYEQLEFARSYDLRGNTKPASR
jgi:hypothetical protein